MREKSNRSTPLTKVYEMRVDTVEEAFKKLCSAHPEIEYVLYPEVEKEDGSTEKLEINRPLLDFMMDNVLTYVREVIPSFERMENIRTNLVLKSNKVSLQTNAFMAFSWFIGYKKNEDKTGTVEYVDMSVTLHGVRSVSEYESHLIDEGWKIKID